MPSCRVYPRHGEVSYLGASDDYWRRLAIAKETNHYRWRALVLKAMLAVQGHTLLIGDINRACGENADNLDRVRRLGARLFSASPGLAVGMSHENLAAALSNPHNLSADKARRKWAISDIRRQLDGAEYALTKAALCG